MKKSALAFACVLAIVLVVVRIHRTADDKVDPVPQIILTSPILHSNSSSSNEMKKAVETQTLNSEAKTAVRTTTMVPDLIIPDLKDTSEGFRAEVLGVSSGVVRLKREDDGKIRFYKICAHDRHSVLRVQTVVKLFAKSNCVALEK